MSLEISADGPGAASVPGLALEGAAVETAREPLRKDVALLTSFLIGFVVIAFFGAVLVITSAREERFSGPSGAAPAAEAPLERAPEK
jgi:hypothetical protein